MDQGAKPDRTLGLAVGAIGVVFGDIGTSPLYTIRECFGGEDPLELSTLNILGILSLVFWSIMVIVTLKYVLFVMRADNRGEGGDLALMALAMHALKGNGRASVAVMMVGLTGTALFYGDAMITPAISVLSAIEGLEVAAPALHSYIVPLSLAVLFGLFLIQNHGTARVGTLFAPVMVLWFLTLAVLGLKEIIGQPHVLNAINPIHAVRFMVTDGLRGFLILGAVVLAFTGAEALYADMGHFGRKPIRLAWFGLAMPALLLNYFGQGALLISEPDAVHNPFYRLVPSWGLYPLIALATAATVIASQAVISGVFSMTRQAIQLGYAPRTEVRQTSEHQIGQIYLPQANWALMIAIILLVVGFRSSSNLAAAYGIAVTGTMITTTIMSVVVARRIWKWSLPACIAIGGLFLAVDLAFFTANAVKIPSGGWFPLAIAGFLLLLFTTWKRGKQLVAARLKEDMLPLDDFIARIRSHPPPRVPGTAIYLTANRGIVPTALLHNLKHNKVLHERVIIVTVLTEDIPRIPPGERCEIRHLGGHFHRVLIRFGFMESPNIPEVLSVCGGHGLEIEMMDTSFFISRETLIATHLPGMALWREKMFVAMARNASSATDFFHIPSNRVIELGTQIQI